MKIDQTSPGTPPMRFAVRGTVIVLSAGSAEAALTEVERRLRAGEGFALATLNLDHLVKLRRSAAFRRAYAAQDLVTADGRPVVWLSRLAGRPAGLAPGSDMVVPLALAAARAGVPVALVGSTEPVLRAAAARLVAQAPGLTVAACEAPPMGFDPEDDAAGALIDRVAASGARLWFLALGAPRQEMLAARIRARAPAVGTAAIGAGLDFLAGHQRRAPLWVRRIAMEWLWRMLGNPRRLFLRYAAAALILPAEAVAALRLRRHRDADAALAAADAGAAPSPRPDCAMIAAHDAASTSAGSNATRPADGDRKEQDQA